MHYWQTVMSRIGFLKPILLAKGGIKNSLHTQNVLLANCALMIKVLQQISSNASHSVKSSVCIVTVPWGLHISKKNVLMSSGIQVYTLTLNIYSRIENINAKWRRCISKTAGLTLYIQSAKWYLNHANHQSADWACTYSSCLFHWSRHGNSSSLNHQGFHC